MKKYAWSILAGLMLVGLVGVYVWAAQQTLMVPRSSNAWSQGNILGQSPLKRPVTLQPGPEDGVLVIWKGMDGHLLLTHLADDGTLVKEQILPLGPAAVDPQLQVGPQGKLHLLWREEQLPSSTVYYAILETDGTLTTQPRALSDPDNPVLDPPALIFDVQHRLHAVWADETGVWWAELDDGQVIQGPALLAIGGQMPAVCAAPDGHLHLAFHQQGIATVVSVHYLALDPATGQTTGPVEVVELFLRTGQRLQESAVGVTAEKEVYVLWWVQDFKYVESYVEYVSFPTGSPQEGQIRGLALRRGRSPAELYVPAGQRDGLAMAISQSVPDPKKMGSSHLQISVVTLGVSDRPREQVVSASQQASMEPVLVQAGPHQHLAWLETVGFGSYRVIYASTDPDVKRNYDAVSLLSVADSAFTNVFSLSLLVVAGWAVIIMWALIPLIGLVIYHVATSDEMLDRRRPQIALASILALEVGLSFAIPPRIGVEAAWGGLRWLAPTVAAVAGALAVYLQNRKQRSHLFGSFFLFTATNCVVQMVLYFLL